LSRCALPLSFVDGVLAPPILHPVSRSVSDLESDVAAARDDAAQQVRQMRSAQEASAAELHKLRLEHKGSVDRMLQEQVEETRSLTASFQQARELLQDQLGLAQEQLREWQSRFERRESRPEDLAQIEAMRKQLKEKDEIVRRTYEEMKYFKLELKNREENFNKTFGNQPRVGTLNPLQASAGKQGAATALRSTVSQVSAMSAGVNAFGSAISSGDGGGGIGGVIAGIGNSGGPVAPLGVPLNGRRRSAVAAEHPPLETAVDATTLPPLASGVGANKQMQREGRRVAAVATGI